MFQNVHRLFGVKHIQNLLKELDPEQKVMAVKSIKFHAAMRDQYPVHGCLFEIHRLSYQIQLAEQELQSMLQQLAYYRQQNQPQLQLCMKPNDHTIAAAGEQTSYSDNGHPDNCNNSNSPVIADSMWLQQTYTYNNTNNDDHTITKPLQPPPEALPNQDYSEMHHFFDAIDDRHSYIGSKESYESRYNLLLFRKTIPSAFYRRVLHKLNVYQFFHILYTNLM